MAGLGPKGGQEQQDPGAFHTVLNYIWCVEKEWPRGCTPRWVGNQQNQAQRESSLV